MRRREFTAGVLLAAVPWSVRAQQRATQQRIAIFHPAIPTTLLTETGGGSAWRAFFRELRRLGYVEGENLTIERYSADGHHERYANLARVIVTSSPDLIVTGTNPVVIAFKAATSTLPIVAFMLDPLKAGLVTNLAKPGGNLTGITLDAGVERDAGEVDAGLGQVRDQPRFHRVQHERDNRYCAGRGLESDYDGIGPGDDQIRAAGHDRPGHTGVALVMPIGGIAFDDEVFTFDITQAA